MIIYSTNILKTIHSGTCTELRSNCAEVLLLLSGPFPCHYHKYIITTETRVRGNNCSLLNLYFYVEIPFVHQSSQYTQPPLLVVLFSTFYRYNWATELWRTQLQSGRAGFVLNRLTLAPWTNVFQYYESLPCHSSFQSSKQYFLLYYNLNNSNRLHIVNWINDSHMINFTSSSLDVLSTFP